MRRRCEILLENQSQQTYVVLTMSKRMFGFGDGTCPLPAICPLNQVRVGTAVRIKCVSASPEVTGRLRELGFCEERQIKLLSRSSNLICQVCNARFGLSADVAESILVEPVSVGPEVPADNR